MLPVELVQHAVINTSDTAQVTVELQVEPSLSWFEGHFTGQPILPGVAQLDWVMHYAVTLLVPEWRFSAIENIKFQQPILPDTRLRLTLTWLRARQHLTFTFHRLQGDLTSVASSGKIKFTPTSVGHA